MTMYRVKWCKGVPHIEAGSIVLCGTKKSIRRIKFPSEKKLMSFCDGSETIADAIKADMLDVADRFGPVHSSKYRYRKPDPWLMASCIVRLLRLHRKLKKHGLVPKDSDKQD